MTCPHCHKRIDPAALLVAARARAGLTQADAARALGISPQHLCNYESGRRTPRPDRLTEMLATLKGA